MRARIKTASMSISIAVRYLAVSSAAGDLEMDRIANLETSSDYERCTMLRLIPYISTVHVYGALTFPKRLRREVKRSPVLCAARSRVFGARPFGIAMPVEKRRREEEEDKHMFPLLM
jgi:hypothetical protein